MLHRIVIACFAFFAIYSCANKNKTATISTSGDTKEERTDSNTINREEEATLLDTIQWRGKTYVAEIHRYPADSAATIKDDTGVLYSDNNISLKITTGSAVFYDKTFTKNDFREYLPDELFAKYRLNGMVFNTTDDAGLKFACGVGNPTQEDDFIPFDIVVSPNAGTTITKYTSPDITMPTETQGEDGQE